MNQFSLGNAWSKGISFFSPQALNHAIILIGLGVLAPMVLQFAIAGGAVSMMTPAMMGQDSMEAISAMGGALALVMIVGYVLQFGSYFGSWRLGFGEGESLAGAILYGLITSIIVMVLVVLVFIAIGAVAMAAPAAGMLILLVLLLPLLAMFATVISTMISVILFLMVLMMAAFGASMTQMPGFANAAAGGGIALLIMLAITAAMFWLTVRFSCTTAIMADRKTFNLFAAAGESWRLTAANQWRIMGYLALLGIVLLVVAFVLAMIVGAGMVGAAGSGNATQVGATGLIAGIVVGVPLAYLMVLVPAGIYRELAGTSEASARVFA
jgi:hypothetical protein